MKAVILAGGLGTRLSEETDLKPKPMVDIGGMPILWHLMKIYSHHGINDFIVCLGYKGYVIKEYFANYFLHMSDVTFDIQGNHMEVRERNVEPWRVSLVNTCEATMTGRRLKRVKKYIGDEDFCMTYGDGLSDVDIAKTIAFHQSHKKLATLTAVKPAGRNELLIIDNLSRLGSNHNLAWLQNLNDFQFSQTDIRNQNEIFTLLEKKLNVTLEYEKLPPRTADQKIFWADIKKTKNIFEWAPTISAPHGIDLMLAWLHA